MMRRGEHEDVNHDRDIDDPACRCGFALAITDHKDTEPERERESKRQVTDYDLDDEHGGGAGF